MTGEREIRLRHRNYVGAYLASEESSHDDRGEDGRGGGRRPFQDRFEDVVFDPPLLGYVYEAVGQRLADAVGYPGRQYGYYSLLRRVAHEPSLRFSLRPDQYPCRTARKQDQGPGGPSSISKSSSTGGFSSCWRQPVAAKQRIRTLLSDASIRRKFLKSGGSFQSKNSEKR